METVVKEWKYKIVISLNHQCHEASIKNEWHASEPYKRKKRGTERQSETHIRYIASLSEKYHRNTRMKLASALLLCRQCSHRKDFATLNICWLIYPAIYCSCSPYGSNHKCCDICLTKCPFSVYPFRIFGYISPIMCTQNRQIGYIYFRFPNL